MRGIGGILTFVLFTAAVVCFGDASHANQCASFFVTKQSPTKFELHKKLSQLKKQERKDVLFSIVKHSQIGREILSQMQAFVRIEFRDIQGIGFFENSEFGQDRIVINKNLKLGTAAAVLVHELTHARDHIVGDLLNTKLSYNQKTLITEYNAYLNEKIFTHEMSQYPDYKTYVRQVQFDKINNLLSHTMDAEIFASLMLSAEGIDWARTRQFLKTIVNNDFRVKRE